MSGFDGIDRQGVHTLTDVRGTVLTMEMLDLAVEVSREREHARGPATPLYTVPADPLRKLLKL